MIEMLQYLERIRNQLVGFGTLDIDHKAQTAGVVFKLRVIEALFQRCGRLHPSVVLRILSWIAGHRLAKSTFVPVFFT
jgi:hypothetical protein